MRKEEAQDRKRKKEPSEAQSDPQDSVDQLSLKPFADKSIKNSPLHESEKGNSSHSSLHSIRQEAFEWLRKNPLLTAKPLSKLMDLDYSQYKNYLKKLRGEWKRNHDFGVGSRCPKQHHVRAFCYAPKSCDRASAAEVGWKLSRNRNKTLCWNKDRAAFGRVEWFTSGKILIHVKKPQTLIRAKQLATRAFFETGLIFDTKILGAFLDSIHWKGSDDVYEFPERLPYKVIDNYVESHGIRIVLGDASHPNGLEVQWCYPDWLERLELLFHHNTKAIEEFSKFMKDLSQPKQQSKDSDRSMVV